MKEKHSNNYVLNIWYKNPHRSGLFFLSGLGPESGAVLMSMSCGTLVVSMGLLAWRGQCRSPSLHVFVFSFAAAKADTLHFVGLGTGGVPGAGMFHVLVFAFRPFCVFLVVFYSPLL